MRFGPTNGMPFFFFATHPKKCSKFENVSIACSKYCYSRVDESIKIYKVFHIKSTSFVDVQAIGRNLYERLK
jgi:hypothetical protein